MTFKEYLATRRNTNTPQGDFTKDALRDKNLPDVKAWEELESYLRMKAGGVGVIRAARSVWRAYSDRNRLVD
jgi:uncharacterized protein YozE (UPF0346 family)